MKIQVINSENATNFIQARRETGVILSALNLFMLGFLRQHPEFPNSAIFWCDGLMGELFMKAKGYSTKKLRGIEMLKAALAANSGRSACIIGSCSDSAKKVLVQHGVEIAQHYSLDSLNLDNFDCSLLSLNSDFVLVTLPSPKQELLSLKLAAIPANSDMHFFCIGGALNMLAHPELDCPRYFRVLGLEFVFRLRTDTVRRMNRLVQSFFSVARNILELAKCELFVINR